MNRILFSFVCLFLANTLSAQMVTFESLPLTTTEFWRGDPGSAITTTFSNNGARFINRHDTSSIGDYWSGWAYSKLKDTTSLSYTTNDCASITYGGNNGSNQYGVAYYNPYQTEFNSIKLYDSTLPFQYRFITNMYITNSTIAYRSMQNGDGYAKKFGGTTGNDPDYFRIQFSFWNNATLAGTKTFYLADFRDSNNVNDFIIKDWTNMDVNLTADSISYTMESSDTNSFGMKTPTYFCMDDLMFLAGSVSQNQLPLEFYAFPNPVINELHINNRGNKKYSLNVVAMNGAIMGQTTIEDHSSTIMNMSQLAPGVYSLQMNDGQTSWTYKLLKP